MVFSLPWPGSPCKTGLLSRALVGFCTGLRSILWAGCLLKGHLVGIWVLHPLKSLDPILDFSQGLTHLANLSSQVSHPLADDMHAVCHVSVDSYQFLAELPEQVCLLRVGMEKLPVKAGEGWAPGAWARGSAGWLGSWGWVLHFLPLAGSFWLIRWRRGAEERGPRELIGFCTVPLQRWEMVFPWGAWHFLIFISLKTEQKVQIINMRTSHQWCQEIS